MKCPDPDTPCVNFTCRNHLWIDIAEGRARDFTEQPTLDAIAEELADMVVEDLTGEEKHPRCVLDLVGPGGLTQEDVGELLRVSKQTISEIEMGAARSIADQFPDSKLAQFGFRASDKPKPKRRRNKAGMTMDKQLVDKEIQRLEKVVDDTKTSITALKTYKRLALKDEEPKPKPRAAAKKASKPKRKTAFDKVLDVLTKDGGPLSTSDILDLVGKKRGKGPGRSRIAKVLSEDSKNPAGFTERVEIGVYQLRKQPGVKS